MQTVMAAGAVVVDEVGRVLLVLRGHEPQAGRWSVPGGRMEPGETLVTTAVREVREETSLEVVADRELGVVRVVHGSDTTYEVHDFACTVVGGAVAAADDADDVGWFTADEMAGMPLTTDLLRILGEYGVVT